MTRRLPILLVLLLLPAAATAQEREVPTIPFEGTEVFRYLLHKVGKATPVKSFEEFANLPPEDTTLVVFGGLDPLDRLGDLLRWQKRGGTILVASDYPDRGHLRPWHLSVAG